MSEFNTNTNTEEHGEFVATAPTREIIRFNDGEICFEYTNEGDVLSWDKDKYLDPMGDILIDTYSEGEGNVYLISNGHITDARGRIDHSLKDSVPKGDLIQEHLSDIEIGKPFDIHLTAGIRLHTSKVERVLVRRGFDSRLDSQAIPYDSANPFVKP